MHCIKDSGKAQICAVYPPQEPRPLFTNAQVALLAHAIYHSSDNGGRSCKASIAQTAMEWLDEQDKKESS